jgi:predicted ArsR family transcriptional regulator
MSYPHKAGYKARSTSKAAAKAADRKAMPLRERVYQVIAGSGRRGTTADEAAEILGASILAIRPRVSELAVMGRLQDTMERRINRGSGRHAIVWRAK